MEEWEVDFEWLRIRHWVKDQFNKETLPDLDALLFLIGVQELGRWKDVFTKEEKQDLMHIAVCRLMSYHGFYEFKGRDGDGWPHWQKTRIIPEKGLADQEVLLKNAIIQYFHEMEEQLA